MTKSEPSAPTRATFKKLFAKSGDRCAFPRCTAKMVQGDTIIGEVCHISAASPNGPRYDPQQSPAERHGFDNLILLCANHHLVIDDDPEAYTVERLRKMKANHESTAATLGAAEIDHGTNLLIDQSVHAINQSGGITAHTVNQTFHLPPAPDRIGERKATLTRRVNSIRIRSRR